MPVRNAGIRSVTGCLATLLLSAGALPAQRQINPVSASGNAVTLVVPPTVVSTNDATRWFRKDFVLFPPRATAPAKTIEPASATEPEATALPAPPAVQVPATVENLRRTDRR